MSVGRYVHPTTAETVDTHGRQPALGGPRGGEGDAQEGSIGAILEFVWPHEFSHKKTKGAVETHTLWALVIF